MLAPSNLRNPWTIISIFTQKTVYIKWLDILSHPISMNKISSQALQFIRSLKECFYFRIGSRMVREDLSRPDEKWTRICNCIITRVSNLSVLQSNQLTAITWSASYLLELRAHVPVWSTWSAEDTHNVQIGCISGLSAHRCFGDASNIGRATAAVKGLLSTDHFGVTAVSILGWFGKTRRRDETVIAGR